MFGTAGSIVTPLDPQNAIEWGTPSLRGPPANWRERFLLGSSPLKHARIAMTPDIVRPAHGAAIAEAQVRNKHPEDKRSLFTPTSRSVCLEGHKSTRFELK